MSEVRRTETQEVYTALCEEVGAHPTLSVAEIAELLEDVRWKVRLAECQPVKVEALRI